MTDNRIFKERRDLSIIGWDKTVSLYSDNGLELEVACMGSELVVHLIIDGQDVMSSSRSEHTCMEKAVAKCPENARVLVGGLGYGMVLLYLAESKKTKEVIIIEIDDRVLKLFENPISSYLKNNYPDFTFKIIKGDIHEEMNKHGLFDWVYTDITEGMPPKLRESALKALTPNGIFTDFYETTL